MIHAVFLNCTHVSAALCEVSLSRASVASRQFVISVIFVVSVVLNFSTISKAPPVLYNQKPESTNVMIH